MGKMLLTVLGVVAEMELGFIRDRQRAGIEAANFGQFGVEPASSLPSPLGRRPSLASS